MHRLLPAVSSLTLVTSPVLLESIGVADSTAPCEYRNKYTSERR